jgi:hypothetical protein
MLAVKCKYIAMTTTQQRKNKIAGGKQAKETMASKGRKCPIGVCRLNVRMVMK